jgi:hypothetical protein
LFSNVWSSKLLDPYPNSLFTFRRIFFQKAEDLKGILVSVYKVKATPYKLKKRIIYGSKINRKTKNRIGEANCNEKFLEHKEILARV